ncbi:ALBINO3-like protein 2, chloroplastic isoform X1 [Nymphaea colorata]|nr:ALBINO3-like protein 2, chloroplastic isoform X1 [Nymphaea colorata]
MMCEERSLVLLHRTDLPPALSPSRPEPGDARRWTQASLSPPHLHLLSLPPGPNLAMLAGGLRRLSRRHIFVFPLYPPRLLPFHSLDPSVPFPSSDTPGASPSPSCDFFPTDLPKLVSFKLLSSRAYPEFSQETRPTPDESTPEDVSVLGSDALDLGFTSSEMSGWRTPVDCVIDLLDTAHEFSGFPWWLVISTSTLALRIALLPVTILQLKKMDKIAQFTTRSPPPLSPPSSGSSLKERDILHQKQKNAIGRPSFLWSFTSFFVQAPCFILWMMSIRRMSLDSHQGFDSGGALWFQNLTEYPHGVLGPVFPLLIAGLHFVNVQISFIKFKDQELPGVLGLLQKYYRLWLNFLTIPILFTAFWVPQGSLVYWLTNSSLTAVQQLALKHPRAHQALRLHKRSGPVMAVKIPSEKLVPDELLVMALQHRVAGNQDEALTLLKLATQKDPNMIKALIAMGEILLSKQLPTEASEYFNYAINKMNNEEDEGILISAHLGAGVSLFLQGRKMEGLLHLKRIPDFKEPEDPWGKACYFKGLVTLASALSQAGEKDEAIMYLQMAAVYDPSVTKYIHEIQKEHTQ